MSIYTEKFSKKSLNDKNTSFRKIRKYLRPKPATILDIGCSSGYYGNYLKKTLKSIVWGLEYNKNDAKIAANYLDKVIVSNLEDNNWQRKLKNKKFDAVIFADVLEHTSNPQKILTTTKKIISDIGCVYASIPNICHYTTKLKHLNNVWKYEEYGLMDKTHLHFFNYQEIIQTFEDAGYFIKNVDYVISETPKNDLLNLIINSGLDLNSEKLIQNISSLESRVFQYIIKASPNRPKKYRSYNHPKIINKILKTPEKYKIVMSDVLTVFPEYNSLNNQLLKNEIEQLRSENTRISTILDDITSAKFFKLWQNYVKFKKFFTKK